MWPFSSSSESISLPDFSSYWRKIQTYLDTLYTHDKKILDIRQKAMDKYRNTVKTNPTQAAVYKAIWDKTFDQMATWSKVKSYIDTYLPSWLNASKTTSTSAAGLGVIPLLVLGAASIAALAYVATYGIQMLKEYEIQSKVLTDVENKIISPAQAATILEKTTPTSSTFGSAIGSSMGKPIGIIIGLGVLGAVAYFLYPKLSKLRKN